MSSSLLMQLGICGLQSSISYLKKQVFSCREDSPNEQLLPSIKTPQRLTCAAAVAVFAALVNFLKASHSSRWVASSLSFSSLWACAGSAGSSARNRRRLGFAPTVPFCPTKDWAVMKKTSSYRHRADRSRPALRGPPSPLPPAQGRSAGHRLSCCPLRHPPSARRRSF